MESYISDILDSDASFRAQFERDSSLFHGSSDTRPVPVNVASVPSGVNEVDPSYQTPDYDNYPEEYHRLRHVREQLDLFKKEIDVLVKHVQSLMKYRRMCQACPPSSDKLPKLNEFITRDETRVNDSCTYLARIAKSFNSNEWEQVAELITIRAKDSGTWTKEECSEFLLWTRQYGQKIFIEQKKLLEEMKQAARG
ncbi:hypothetical protein GEMRC1_006723 [Eukaryota sp. GEM-RC1]